MNTPHSTPLRHAVYWLLILAAVGTMIGRIGTVQSRSGKTPLLSANDASRWAALRALVDQGTYYIDDVIFSDAERLQRERDWYSIDIVRHIGPDGQEHYYSSKPPLLVTLLAGPYWLLQKLTGATLADEPFFVVRCLLVLVNVLPLTVYFLLLLRLVERYGTTDWGRLFVMACACFGTFLTTFAVTLNNHTIAAVSAAVTLYAALPIWRGERQSWSRFATAGFFAAFTAANELPALSLVAAVGLPLLGRFPRRTLIAFLPAAAVVAVASLLINHAVHGTWDPAYAHRKDGPVVASVAGRFNPDALDAGRIPQALRRGMADAGLPLSAGAELTPRQMVDGWTLWDPEQPQRYALALRDGAAEVRLWDNWYEFPGSYWAGPDRSDVDKGEPSHAAYAFHVLIGHHGVFSLTPIWLLSGAGLVFWLRRRDERMQGFALFVLALTVVCLGFYLARPLADRNYGGRCCGFRWLFWCAPLWQLVMLPAADRLASRPRWQSVAYALLLISIATASFASLNPWSHPWLYQLVSSLGSTK